MFSLYALVTNYYLVAAVSGWIVAQILKAFTGFFKLQEFSVKTLLFGTGGMPSSHTAAVSGLFTACLLREGFGSPLMAISGVLAMIVMIDAMGVRQETGKQAKALNQILSDSEGKEGFVYFKELIGHSPLQVFCGMIVGIVVASLLYLIPVFQSAPVL